MHVKIISHNLMCTVYTVSIPCHKRWTRATIYLTTRGLDAALSGVRAYYIILCGRKFKGLPNNWLTFHTDLIGNHKACIYDIFVHTFTRCCYEGTRLFSGRKSDNWKMCGEREILKCARSPAQSTVPITYPFYRCPGFYNHGDICSAVRQRFRTIYNVESTQFNTDTHGWRASCSR